MTRFMRSCASVGYPNCLKAAVTAALYDPSMLEALKCLSGGTIHLPSRVKDRPDRGRLAPRFGRFQAAA